jgi:hypothetical protein
MTKQQLQEAIEQRESEVSGYQVNIDNYTRMIAELPCEWPDDLIDFKGKKYRSLWVLSKARQL